MAYRIRYGARERGWESVPLWAARGMVAAGLLLCLLGINGVPGGEARLRRVFLPERESATMAMAGVLRDGGTLRSGAVAFCRHILERAGYGEDQG